MPFHHQFQTDPVHGYYQQDFHLAGEIEYIRSRAAEHDGRFARYGDPEELYFEETDTSFAIGRKGNYRIDGDAFLFIDCDTARLTKILGYPTRRLARLG